MGIADHSIILSFHFYRKPFVSFNAIAKMPKFTVYKGGKGGKVTKSETSKPDLTGDQVLLRVTASGLCGTDLHYREQYVALRASWTGVRC